MNNPAKALRQAACACLPSRAFLKRDRGDALFITNAPRTDPAGDYMSRLAEAGFILRAENGLIRIFPGEAHLTDLESRFPEAPDYLSSDLVRFSGMKPEAENLRLFSLGLRVLDGDPPGDYEERLRKRAAVCLRQHTGGGLYACALVNHIIKKECAL